MIATLTFEPSLERVRRPRFVARPGLALEAACAAARGLRDALASVLGDACAVTLGEPVVLEAAAWRSIAARALTFVLPGAATDIVFVVPERDARALIAAAFHEELAPYDASWSALEAGAVERILARCVPACELLGGAPRGPLRAVEPERVAPCVDFVDVRVAAPVRLTIGIGTTRSRPAPPPLRTLSPAALGAVAIELRLMLGRGSLDAARLLGLRVGEIVSLPTKVAGRGELNVAGQMIALGTCGVVRGRTAFAVESVHVRGDAP